MDNQLARDRWLHTLSHSDQQRMQVLLKTLGVSTGQEIDAIARAVWALAKRGQELEAQAGASGAVAERTLPGVLPGVFPSE